MQEDLLQDCARLWDCNFFLPERRSSYLKNWMADISAPVSTDAGNLTLTFKNFSMGA